MLRTVIATRYVLPLREGGSLPAIVEGDDLGTYVAKFRGAGQGALALVAELVAGEIGRALGLRVPEIVLMQMDAALGRNEPDAEIRHLLQASTGLNLALDYLPGSIMFDPAAPNQVDVGEASLAVWFDAFTQNVDRTARNANLLVWHRRLYLIDHGAALYVHHDWETMPAKAAAPFAPIAQHVLLRWASDLQRTSERAQGLLNRAVFAAILDDVRDAWLAPAGEGGSPQQKRAAYVDFLERRLQAADTFTQEAMQAHASLV